MAGRGKVQEWWGQRKLPVTSTFSTSSKKKKPAVGVGRSRKLKVDHEEEQKKKIIYGKPVTTMTGLPLSVRNNPNGMKYPEKRIKPPVKPRVGTYIYTYGLGGNERQVQLPLSPPPPQPPPPVVKPERPKEVDFADSIKRAFDLKNPIAYSPSLAELMKQTGNPISLPESVKNLRKLESLWDDVKDNATPKASSASLTASELDEALKAFEFDGIIDTTKSKESSLQIPGPSRRTRFQSLKNIEIQDPPVEAFQPSYRLLPHIQEKLIEEQVRKEFAAKKLVPKGSEFTKRKQELMQAAAKSGYNEKSSVQIFPDLVQEYDYNDLFKHDKFDYSTPKFDILRRPNYTSSQENPSRHIQKLSPLALDPKNVQLITHKESIIGRALREMEQSKNRLEDVDEGSEEKKLPPRKLTNAQERNRQLAIRTLENYRLIQERQREIIHRIPEVTIKRLNPEGKISKGSEFHQIALNHTHRSHRPREDTFHSQLYSRFKPEPSKQERKDFVNAALNRRDQEYPTYTALGLPPPPPPISSPNINIGGQQKKKKGRKHFNKQKSKKLVHRSENRFNSDSSDDE